MKLKTPILLLVVLLFFAAACSNDNDPLTPPDYSDLVKGNWLGVAGAQGDTLSFDMTLDAEKNEITGTSKFEINGERVEDLNITGTIDYPTVNLHFKSSISDFTFRGAFLATNSDNISGELQNQKYGAVPIIFVKQKSN